MSSPKGEGGPPPAGWLLDGDRPAGACRVGGRLLESLRDPPQETDHLLEQFALRDLPPLDELERVHG